MYNTPISEDNVWGKKVCLRSQQRQYLGKDAWWNPRPSVGYELAGKSSQLGKACLRRERFSCAPPPGRGLQGGGPSCGRVAPTPLAPPTPRAFILAPSWGQLCHGADVGDRVPREAEARPGPPTPPAASHPPAHALQTGRSQAART